ncbi:hypothetical protein [Propylenella binzhouense]|uniref:Uncharacterized protein n=1 Tax=Propylenella binzhouense TaxID=2555902 RepID=A0A964WVB6_9HYPH|nr:hypothetical protein [Propylenella binzhouense]MYZ50016.1 hypothetical protein [Propylenella binzhouense]
MAAETVHHYEITVSTGAVVRILESRDIDGLLAMLRATDFITPDEVPRYEGAEPRRVLIRSESVIMIRPIH